MKICNRHSRSRIAIAIAMACSMPSAFAQAQPVPTTPPDASMQVLDTVVIATKRAKSMQDVPVAMTSVSSDQLERNNVVNIFSLQALVPSLQVTTLDPPGQGTAMMLRGLGNSAFNMGFDPAVATFVDGISRSRSGLVASTDFLDLERIEVLKGPQGTLFGKNTTAGLVQMISRKPTLGEREGSFSVGYSSFNTISAKGSVNMPVSDTVALRVAATMVKGDGWLTLAPTGDKIHDRDRQAVKLQVLIKPSADFSAHIIADYANVNEACCTAMRLTNDSRTAATNGPLATAMGSTIINPPDLGALRAEQNIIPRFKATDKGLSADLNWKLGGGTTLTSLTGWRDYSDSAYKDNDFSGADILYNRSNLPKVGLLSQELRLAGENKLDGGRSLEWLTGVYYSKEKINLDNSFIWGSQSPKLIPFITPGVAFDDHFTQDVKSMGAFGQVTLQLDKELSVNGGLRYSRDEKTGTLRSLYPQSNAIGLPNVLPLSVVHNYDASLTQSAPTYSLSVQYKLAPRTMTYATVSRGYKAGGISMTRDAAGPKLNFSGPTGCPPGGVAGGPLCTYAQVLSPTFKRELADHFEVGVKADLFDRTVRVNAAAWNTEFTDLQTQTLRPDGSFAVTNANTASSKGVEVESSFALGRGLTAHLAVQYAKARFGDNIPAATPGFLAFSNQRLPFSSDWTVGAGMGYRTKVSAAWTLDLDANVNYRSEYFNFSELRADLVQKGFASVNLRAGLSSDKWDVALWCRNCTDQRATYSNFAIPFDGTLFGHGTRWAHIAEPRTIGVSTSYNF